MHAMDEVAAFVSGLRIEPGSAPGLAARDAGVRAGADDKTGGLEQLEQRVARLAALHTRLAAEATRSLVLVLQGLDASGKDGTIRNVLTGINPQGCKVVSFREPTSTELAHDYLWRIHAQCPARGEIAIFNRSHYEDVVAVRVRRLAPQHVWRRRYAQIRAFERLLCEEGTAVVKVFLHVSRDEQRTRLQERLEDPEKSWKLSRSDLEDRARFDEFMTAYEEAIAETSCKEAPWYVVPADHNWVRNLAVAEILVETLERLHPKLPPPDPELAGLEVS
jgi:PPK2 family polyphosphate:nucleotide phosphotransferase